jgi:hypothetical protein
MYGEINAWSVPGYTEVRDLGTGGAGRVVLARRDSADTLVAIKYLSDQLLTDPGFVARFRHEARLLAMMEPNSHVARFYEYVEGPHGAAIIMELVDGVSLRTMLRSEGPTGPEAALAVLKGSLLGLATAHSIGVVHRDYKPENVLVDISGTSKLVDFGIAARAGEGVNVAGSPPYMAPEQWLGGHAGPTSDVYAATVVFFECLTGTRPFHAQSLAALARQHQTIPPPVEQVSPALQGLIRHGMAKHAKDRPPTAEAFLRELEAVATQAYGPAWEERGRRRLAALAGLLLPFFPLTEEAPEANTALAQSAADGGGRFGKVGMRIGLTTLLMAVITGGTVALVNSMTSTTLQAGTSVAAAGGSPTIAINAAAPGGAGTAGDPGTAGGTGTPEESFGPEETDPVESPSPIAKTRAPKSNPREGAEDPATQPARPARPAKQATATKKSKPAPKAKARAATKPKPSPTPTDDETVSNDGTKGDETTRPSERPSRPNPPSDDSPPPSSDTSSGSTPPSDSGTPAEPSTARAAAAQPTAATLPMAVFAVGLVTTGLVPATLAVKRMAGRHRRRR